MFCHLGSLFVHYIPHCRRLNVLTTYTQYLFQLVIQGELQYRLGVLLLSEGQVEVLGGKVEHLVEANAAKKVLGRLL